MIKLDGQENASLTPYQKSFTYSFNVSFKPSLIVVATGFGGFAGFYGFRWCPLRYLLWRAMSGIFWHYTVCVETLSPRE